MKARLVTVVLDSCYAGQNLAQLQQALSQRAQVLVLAGDTKQTAKTCDFNNGASCPGHTTDGSVFTRWLLREMKNSRNDRDGNRQVSWREALEQTESEWLAREAFAEF